jgi:hypothetical protein
MAERPELTAPMMGTWATAPLEVVCFNATTLWHFDAAEWAFREIAALPTGSCGLMGAAQDVIQAPKPEPRIMRAAKAVRVLT